MPPSPTHFPPLPGSETAHPPPPPDPEGTYFYGYKLFDNYDEHNQEHEERMADILFAVARMGLYARISRKYPTVMVFLAIYSPKTNVITPRAGNSRVPCQRRLDVLQQEMGIDFGPTWHIDDGTVFTQGYTVQDFVRSIQPIKGLWTL